MKPLQFALLAFLFTSLSSFGQTSESLKIFWPEEYSWQVGSIQENESLHIMELIPSNEKIESWSIIGTMMAIKGAKDVPMEMAMNLMFDSAKENAPKAKLTLIEMNEEVRNPWVIFKIEAPSFHNDPKPESQLYYIVQGESTLYSNFVAVKEKSLDRKFVRKWQDVFKASELVVQ
jgi:hypothetical protein